jgi:hypothetical protein
MLQRRDLMPMFSVTSRIDGTRVDYKDVWQRMHLLLVGLPDSDRGSEAYAAALLPHANELRSGDVRMILTSDRIAGVPCPGVVVADRWGEIFHVHGAEQPSSLPPIDDLLEWVRFVQVQCPECQGETR